MDPNKTLEEIRAYVRIILSGVWCAADVEDFTENVEALDEWLSKGGYLPADWQGRS